MDTVTRKFKELFCSDPKIMRSISEGVREENQRCLKVFSLIAAFAFLIMAVSSRFDPSISSNFPAYFAYVVICIIFYFLSGYCKTSRTVQALVYLFTFCILFFGILLGAVFTPDQLSVSFVVLLMAIPLAFTARSIVINCILVLSMVVYTVIAHFTQDSEMFMYNLFSILPYGIVSMLISSFIMNIKIQRIHYRQVIEDGAVHDQLTGCLNRKGLAWIYDENFDNEQPVVLIMCDLNGLKAINDTQGHVAGDRFITRTADQLKNTFGDRNVYRMGGDEFIALMVGEETKKAEEKFQAARLAIGDTASFGIECRERLDVPFDELLKVADKKMYTDKQNYYATHGDRRSRRSSDVKREN